MDTLSELLTLTCERVKQDKKWKSVSRIVGEAVEDCIITMPCPLCKETSLQKYKTNEKSKDIKCEACTGQFQIKATKHTKKNQSSLKLLGAEYKTTCSSIKENTIHYLVVLYSFVHNKYTMDDILFIDCANINESCIIPRKPLSSTAVRAGWQGCMLVFTVFRSIKY